MRIISALERRVAIDFCASWIWLCVAIRARSALFVRPLSGAFLNGHLIPAMRSPPPIFASSSTVYQILWQKQTWIRKETRRHQQKWKRTEQAQNKPNHLDWNRRNRILREVIMNASRARARGIECDCPKISRSRSINTLFWRRSENRHWTELFWYCARVELDNCCCQVWPSRRMTSDPPHLTRLFLLPSPRLIDVADELG